MAIVPLGPVQVPPQELVRSLTKLEQIELFLNEGNPHEAFRALTLFVVPIDEGTDRSIIQRVYAILLRLIPMAAPEDLDKLSEDCHGSVLQRLFLFPSLADEQYQCAIAFGNAHLAYENFTQAMGFSSAAIDIAGEHFPVRSKEAHQLASAVFFRALEIRYIDLQAYQDSLSVERGRGGEEPFLKALEYVESVRQYAALERDTEFVKKLYRQAEEVLLSLPTDRRSSYRESTERVQGGTLLKLAPAEEVFTERASLAMLKYRREFRKEFQVLSPDPESVRAFQKKRFLAFQNFMEENFFAPILQILRTLPCGVNFLAMGSVAREEICPHSDLEWVAVIEDPEQREKFYPFIELLDLLMRSLRESPLPQQFSALCSPEKSGLHLDPQSKFEEYIMASQFPMPRSEELGFEPRSLPHMMCRVRTLFHQGDDLYPMFNASKRGVLDESVDGKPIRAHRALKLMRIRLAEFKQLGDPFANDLVDIKQHFSEPLFHLLGDLALYYGLEETNTLDVVDALEGVFTEQTRDLLKNAVAKIYHRRVELHLEHGKQHEMTSPIGFEQVQVLVLEPLYAHLEVWLEKEQFEEVDLIESAFSNQVIAFAENANLAQAKRFIEIFKPYLGDDQEKLQHYYEKLSTDTRLDPLREMFVQGMPEDSPLLAIPNRDGYRQSFRVDYKQLDAMIVNITTNQPTQVEVIGLQTEEKRYLSPEIVSALVDERGHVRRHYPGSAHPVMRLQGEGFDVHCKEMPTQPLMEYAVHSFTSRLMGEGTTPSRLVRFQLQDGAYYPVLISKTVRGRILSDELSLETETVEGHPTTSMREIDMHSFTWMLIRAILLKPGDERGSNFIVDEKGRLTCVDNDVAFVEPIVKTGVMSSKVYFKTLLPFLSDQPLDRSVIEAFLQIIPELFLNGWLEDLIRVEKHYVSLYSDKEQDALYLNGQEMQFTPSILLRKGTIAALYTQWISLQEFFRKSSQSLHPFDLLKAIVTLEGKDLGTSEVGKKIYRAYTRAKNLPLAPREKLLKAVQEKQDQSVTNMEAMRASCGRTPKHYEVKNRIEFAPEKALEELQLFLFQNYDDTLEVSKGLGSTHLKADFSKLQAGGQPDLERQRLLMRALHCHHGLKSFQHVTLLNAPSLTLQELRVFFHKELKSLTLSYCSSITSEALVELAATCPKLEELRLENCPGITKIDDGSFFNPKALSFPNLKILHLADCQNLKEGLIHTPERQEIKLNANPHLRLRELNGPYSQELKECVFGKEDWERYFGPIGDVPAFPSELYEILQGPCPIWEGKRVQDTHLLTLIPTTVNGRPLTLDSLKDLIQHPRGGEHATKYDYYNDTVKKELGAQSLPKATWALMTKDVIPDSRNKSYEAQKELVRSLSSKAGHPYELPKALDAAVSILMHHVKRGERLYTDSPLTYTRCQESVNKGRWPVAIGGFAAGGLYVNYGYVFDGGGSGVGGVRKF